MLVGLAVMAAVVGDGDLEVVGGGHRGRRRTLASTTAAQLGPSGEGGLDRPAGRRLQLGLGLGVARVSHGHHEVAAVEVDGHGQVLAGQLGRDEAVEGRG